MPSYNTARDTIFKFFLSKILSEEKEIIDWDMGLEDGVMWVGSEESQCYIELTQGQLYIDWKGEQEQIQIKPFIDASTETREARRLEEILGIISFDMKIKYNKLGIIFPKKITYIKKVDYKEITTNPTFNPYLSSFSQVTWCFLYSPAKRLIVDEGGTQPYQLFGDAVRKSYTIVFTEKSKDGKELKIYSPYYNFFIIPNNNIVYNTLKIVKTFEDIHMKELSLRSESLRRISRELMRTGKKYLRDLHKLSLLQIDYGNNYYSQHILLPQEHFNNDL